MTRVTVLPWPLRSSGRGSLAAWLLLVAWAPPRVEGGSPPEVVRLRVPAGQVATIFPPGTTMRTLAVERFEGLLDEAGSNAGRRSQPLRSVRVEHAVRWDGAFLVGQSRVTLPATSGEPTVVLCDPWSPAILAADEGPSVVRVDPAGRVVLLQPANQPVAVATIPWRQAALPDSFGRAFALRLPAADITALTLELPAEVVPTRRDGGLQGVPTSSTTGGLVRWEFAGAGEKFTLDLRSAGAGEAGPNRLWAGGATRIDLNAAGANWEADWQVERAIDAPPTCLIDLDSGLELVDVTGPAVRGYRLVAHDQVEVTFRDRDAELGGATTLRLRCRVEPPLAGPWLIPSARPSHAGWLGGRTEVRVDPARVVTAWTERSGRRVAALAGESAGPSTLIFESDARPGSLAELQFDRPAGNASVEVEGTIRIGSFAPRFEVAATWNLGRRGRFDPTLDVPAGWLVNRVAVGGERRAPISWHVEPLAGGGHRVHLDSLPRTPDAPARTETVLVSATRIEANPNPGASAGPLPLPRVRPGSGAVRVAEERWVAEVEPGWELEPTAVGPGLTWLDPAPPVSPGNDEVALGAEAPPIPAPPMLRSEQQLAWRWVSDSAEASVIRRHIQHRPRVDERLDASIVAGQLRLVWYWTIAGPGRPDALAFHLPLGSAAASRWRVETATGAGPTIEPRPLDLARRSAFGLPATGFAAEVALHHLPPGRLVLRGEAEVAWSGSGSIPLSTFPASVATGRAVEVAVAESARFRIDRSDGLTRVARGEIDGVGLRSQGPEPSPRRAIFADDAAAVGGIRHAAAWIGAGGPARLDVTTAAAPDPVAPQGVITEATLTTRVAPGTDLRNRLILRVAPGPARTLDLELPDGVMLDRVRRDGQASVASAVGATLRVDLTPNDQTRRTTTLTLDYRLPAAAVRSAQIHPTSLLPRVALPCLSFVWQVNAPERFAVSSSSPDLVDTDLVGRLAAVDRGAVPPPGQDAGGPIETTMFDELEHTLVDAPPVETTLGDWLLKLDSGRWPLVLDRLALQSVGWGPKSRINVVAEKPGRPMPVRAVFHALGLTLEPMGAAFLVSTEADQRIDQARANLSPEDRASLGQTLFDAAIAGADRSDRYQSPTRWRGEPTPRAWLATETPDRGLVAFGWRLHRFAASSWPTATAVIRLDDLHVAWRAASLGGAGMVALGLLVGATRGRFRRLAARRLATVVAAGIFGLTCSASAQVDRADPIVAVLPYDDLAGWDARPDRVILSQEDHDRLVRAARRDEGATSPRVLLVAATHHVGPVATRSVAVASRYTLEVVATGVASWTFPVGSGFDLAATLGGQPVPLAISPDGRTATVAGLPAGRSLVEFRRSFPAAGGAGDHSIRVDVGRAAVARVEVERGDWTGPIDLLDLAGGSATDLTGWGGELGPRDEVEVRWRNPGTETPSLRPELAATIRWDAQAAGDRVVSRCVVAGRDPLRTIRLSLEPGLAVVGQAIPGLVGVRTSASPAGWEWVAHVDPPLAPGRTFEVTFWRPAPPLGAVRTMPLWGLVGGRLAGLVGFRRPDNWSGRFVASAPRGGAAATDLDFTRAWGPLAADGLVLAGVARWDGVGAISFQVAPEPPRRGARGQVGVEVVPGALKFVAESVLTDRLGMGWDAEARFDGPVRLVRVDAAGLSSWTQPAPDRVRLVFDGSIPPRERVIRFGGTVEAATTAAGERGRPLAAVVPWPRWVGAAADPGTLIVAGVEGLEVRAGDRVIPPDLPDPTRPVTAAGSLRRTYQVRPADPVLRLTWVAPPAQVSVTVASNLQLEPTRAVWTADLICEAAGGPVEKLHWKLPSSWAEQASLLSTEGDVIRVEAETRGEVAFWTILLDRPIWHRRTLRLRSSRPLEPGTGLDYPDIAPLSSPGRGTVNEYHLTITNLSGRSIRLEPAGTGLTSLDPSPLQPDLPRGTASREFRVGSEPWSLRVVPAGSATAAPPTAGFDDRAGLARVARADFELAVDSTGRSMGQAECQVAPGAPFLAVFLERGIRLLGVSVAGQPVVPIEPGATGDERRWLIPLGDRDARQVVFGWVQSEGTTGRLPWFDDPAVPATVRLATTARSPSDDAILGPDWTRLSPLEASIDRFERWGGEVIAAASRTGRDATLTRSGVILDRLVAMALELRAVDRTFRVAGSDPRLRVDVWHEVDDRVSAAVTDAGLGTLLDEARRRVGLEPPSEEPGQTSGPEGVQDVYRVRQIGWVESFRGTLAARP